MAYTRALFYLAAFAYFVLLLLLVLSKRPSTMRWWLASACAVTAGTCVAMGWANPANASMRVLEFASTGCWTAFLLYILQKHPSFRVLLASGTIILSIITGSTLFALITNDIALQPSTDKLLANLALGVFGVTLIENLYRNMPGELRWHINLLCAALGGIFCYSILFYADALLFHRISMLLWSVKPIVLIAAMPLLAVTAARNRDWAIDIHVSRTVVFHTTALVVGGVFLLALAITGELVRMLAPDWGDLAEVSLMVAGITSVAVAFSSGAARSRLRRFLAENFFSHRFDYRREWIKSTDILSTKHSSVQTRAISSVAEIADSPAGILWVRDQDGNAFQWAGSWNHIALASAEPADSDFVALFRGGSWIVELDQTWARPNWLADISRAWLAVPLPLQDELLGFIVLSQPRAPTTLDGETFDLLRIVARQAAIHVAEQRYAQTLSDVRRLHDFSNRFAFVVHDIKNVVSQLTLILQNAQQHRHNPEFYEDVLATVGSSVERMNKMLARLRAPRQAAAANGVIVPIDLINEEIANLQRARGISIDVKHDGDMAVVAMEADSFRSVIAHLCQNAVEASEGNVQLRLRHDALRLEIEIADRGAGMPAEFIRDDLFQPLRSSKGDGFGIGAYQARELVRAAGGDILVSSRPGAGTTMRILLPCITQESSESSALRREEMSR